MREKTNTNANKDLIFPASSPIWCATVTYNDTLWRSIYTCWGQRLCGVAFVRSDYSITNLNIEEAKMSYPLSKGETSVSLWSGDAIKSHYEL